MLKRFFALFSPLMCMAASLFGYIHPDPNGWGVQGEYLYFYPSIDDTYFVTDFNASSTNGKRKNNDFDFDSGFRVEGSYGLCDCGQEILVRYTRFCTQVTREVSGTTLFPTIGLSDVELTFSGTASSKNSILYQRLDGLFALQAWQWCTSSLYLQGGIEWAYLRLNSTHHFDSPSTASFDTLQEKARTWGIGPQLGLDFSYGICQFSGCLPGTLSFSALTSASLLTSRIQEKATEVSTAHGLFEIDDDPTWRIIPALHARFGINYATCFACVGLSLEIGYEFNSYVKALSHLSSYKGDTTIGSLHMSNFDAQGLYTAIGIIY